MTHGAQHGRNERRWGLPGRPAQTANARRTQVDTDPSREIERSRAAPERRAGGGPHGDPHDQDWIEVAEEVREAVEEAEPIARRGPVSGSEAR